MSESTQHSSVFDDSDSTLIGEDYYYRRWQHPDALKPLPANLPMAYDGDRDACTEGLGDTGHNLEPTGMARDVGDESPTHVLTLAALRYVLLNMHSRRAAERYQFVHTRLREYCTLEERKRLVALLNTMQTYPSDTLPHYLGCMRMVRNPTSVFTVASGCRIPLMRMVFWVCDNDATNFMEDEAVLTVLSETARLKGIAALRYRFTVENTCETVGCVNTQHYKRVNSLTTSVADARRLAEDESTHFQLLSDHWADTQAFEELAQLRLYTEACSEDWVTAERTMARDSYLMSPLEAGLTNLSVSDVYEYDDDDDPSHGDEYACTTVRQSVSSASASASSSMSSSSSHSHSFSDSASGATLVHSAWKRRISKRGVVIPSEVPVKSKKRKARFMEHRVVDEVVK